MNQLPLISVLMPVYNSELYINEAVESILNQTYQNFEFLIYDDHSTDNTVALIEAYKDCRITLIKKGENTGYTNSLIAGIKSAKGKYIARMDSDDISHLQRFEKQVIFLETNLEYGIVGSRIQTIRKDNQTQVWDYPLKDEDIRLHTIINSPLAHPSVMIRRDVLDRHTLNYLEVYEPCEDYKLWTGILNFTKGANLNETLLYYRLHPNQTINKMQNTLIANSNIIRREVLKNLFGIEVTNDELKIHYYYFNEITKNNTTSIKDKYLWRKKMLHWFNNSSYKRKGNELVEKYWLINLRTLAEYEPPFIKFLFNRFLIKNFSLFETVKFAFKCMIRYKTPVR